MHSPTGSTEPNVTSSSLGFRILVVVGDDGASNRARAHLDAAGYDVIVADMPDIGLVRRVEPDAVVLGILFRGEPTGLDFLTQHAADPVTARIPVLVLAAVAELTDAQRERLLALRRAMVALTTDDEELAPEIERVLMRNT